MRAVNRWRRFSALALANCLLLAGCAGAGQRVPAGLAGVGKLPRPASAWPQAGYDARHSSASAAIGPQQGRLRWSAQLAGDLTPGPVIGIDGSVLQASNSGVLYALDPATGKQRWHYDAKQGYGSDLSTSPAVLTDGTILWPGPLGTLYALTAHGTLAWRERLGDDLLSPAVAGAGRVYVADLSGQLTALEVGNGQHRKAWTLDLGDQDLASPTVGPDGTIYTVAGRYLVAVRDLGDRGVRRWRFRSKDKLEVSNAVSSDGIVMLGTNADKQYGIRSDGKQAWAYDKGEFTYSSSVITPSGKAYFGDNQGRLTVLAASDGKQLLRVQGSSTPRTASIWTSVAVDGRGDFYFATVTGRIYGFDPSGKQLFELDAGAAVHSYPAIGADGTLYFGTVAGKLLAIAPG